MDGDAANSASWAQLRRCDLSIRLLHELQFEVLNQILHRSKNLLPPITLLKGSSVATEYYPQAHLRIMRDLDLLVDETHQATLESILREMGFRQQSKNSEDYYLTHHHSMPFFQASTGVWVEVHRGLFPPASRLGMLPVFRPENIHEQSRLCSFQESDVMRLSPELQIVYTASHWATGLVDLKQKGGLFPLVDTILILKSVRQRLRWDLIFKWVENSVAASHLYLLLSYLHENDIMIIDKDVLRQLFARQRSFGMLNLKIAHRLITRYLVSGKVPIARGKLSILWENLLLDRGPTGNLLMLCKRISCFPRMPANQSPAI